MDNDRMTWLNIRLPLNLKELMKRYVSLDTHNDLSEFTRDAIREKIHRDAPQLYAELFKVKGVAENDR